MSNDGHADVAWTMKAVRKAYDDLQALQTRYNSMIPLALLVASTALDKLSCNLNLVTGSAGALAMFRSFSLTETGISPAASLSDALVHDMEAIARHFRLMTPASPVETLGHLDKRECQDIAGMVDRYDRTVFSALVQRTACVPDNRLYNILADGVLTIYCRSPSELLEAQSHDVMDGIDQIRRRLSEQEASKAAKIRTGENMFDSPVSVFATDPCTDVFNRLQPIASAKYDSHTAPTGCLDGTRVEVHKTLSDWANDDTSGLSTMWLNGMAGTGKTAIASTFASTMEDQKILGASFFIDRQHAERRDLRRIVQTLAYDLAKDNHEQLRALRTVLRDDPTFDRLSYQAQVRLLIEEPLHVGGRTETLVVVIDGLDECGASNGASLLTTLMTSLALHPIKLFVTSRNEADMANLFRHGPCSVIKLQEINIIEDVRRYWEHNLDELCTSKNLPDWRSVVSLVALVELTGHLFIYATTLLKVVRNTRTSPIKKLRALLEVSLLGNGSAISFSGQDSQGPLQKLYVHILGDAIKDDDGTMSNEYALRLHDILEAVIFAREPLTAPALSDLLNLDNEELQAYLKPLHSVLVVPDVADPNQVVRPLHQSFPDFVRQQGGLVHTKLVIHSTTTEKHVAEWCLGQLNKHLRFDICDIKDASLLNSEVSDLLKRLSHRVSAALRYSCRYWLVHWLEHIRAVGSQAQVPLGLEVFCKQHLLHWVEVLSLTGDMNAVQRGMPELIPAVNVRFSLTHVTCVTFNLRD
jgi:hypothetical protein